MSRRRGRPHHHDRARPSGPQPTGPGEPRPVQAAEPPQPRAQTSESPAPRAQTTEAPAPRPAPVAVEAPEPVADPLAPETVGSSPDPVSASPEPVASASESSAAPEPVAATREPAPAAATPPPVAARPGPPAAPSAPPRMNGHPPVRPEDAAGAQCTAPQLRRFIKSRPYVPMHELRRRFGINGNDDDVCPIQLEPGRVFVGLPEREGNLLGDLLRAGEIGYELSMDPRTPIVVGVYPMRPVPRP
jgi:hypothetical protein